MKSNPHDKILKEEPKKHHINIVPKSYPQIKRVQWNRL